MKTIARTVKTVKPTDYLLIILGSAIYALSVSLFLDPNDLAPGGMTGIAVILNRLSRIDVGTLYFLLNVPVVLLGLWKFGWRFIIKTAVAIGCTSLFTNLLAPYGAVTEDLLLASVVGGMLMAVGMGLIFRARATTGGTDIIVKVLRQKYRHLKTGALFLYMDLVIVTLAGIVFRDLNVALYALLTVFVNGKAIDYVLYGHDDAKLIYIITDRADEIADRIMLDLDIGCTFLNGKGGWTQEPKAVIMTVAHNRISPLIEEIVKELDPQAFMIIGSASEIYGEGYKDILAEKL